MSESTPSSVWLVCPKCRSRRQVPSDQLGQRILCRQCSTALVAGPADQSAEQPADLHSDELVLELPEEELRAEPPTPRFEVLRKALPDPPAEEIPHEDWVKPPDEASLTWAFFSGVFAYALWPNAVGKWIFLSVFSTITGLLGLVCVMLFAADFRAIVSAGGIAIAAFLIGLFALSYAAACLVDITTNTAYNNDKASDWPNVDWRERLMVLVRVGYLLAIVIVSATGIAKLVSLGSDSFWGVFAMAIFVLFPIALLSSMEADSIWPLSPATWRSLITVWFGWLLFYFLTGLMALVVIAIAAAAFLCVGILAPLIACPFAAAALFSYARLLGRLAWLIQKHESQDDRLNTRYSPNPDLWER